jgi:hypothetical protein
MGHFLFDKDPSHSWQRDQWGFAYCLKYFCISPTSSAFLMGFEI